MSSRNSSRAEDISARRQSDLAQSIVEAREDELRRISQDLHDGAGQGLMLLRLRLELLAAKNKGVREVQEALRLVEDTIGDLRRVLHRLSPRLLEELGLISAIRHEAEVLTRLTGMSAELDLPSEITGLSKHVATQLYRCIQEGLHNIQKHSGAHSFKIRLRQEDGMLKLLIADSGKGFSSKRIPRACLGLGGIKDRIVSLRGNLQIASGNGSGTRVIIEVPCKEESKTEKSLRTARSDSNASRSKARLRGSNIGSSCPSPA